MATSTEVKPAPAGYQLKAVIDLGSTSVRMVVAQVQGDGRFKALESLSQSVAIGSDTFTQGRISRGTTEECVKVLRNFTSVLNEYQVDVRKDLRAVATSAVREARNRNEFLDRLFIATGINVEVIDGSEVARLTFLGIQPLLKSKKVLQKGRLMVAEVGGGSTELLGLDEGRVSFAHIYRMGSYRLRETLDGLHASDVRRMELLESEIEASVRQVRAAAGEGRNLKLLLMGGDARFAARLLNAGWEDSPLCGVSVADLSALAAKVLDLGPEQIVKQHHVAYEEAQTLGPALQIHVRIAEAFRLKTVQVCKVTLRDGLLAEAVSGNAWTEDFDVQILNSVRELGKRYAIDQAHAECVAENALAIFRAMKNEHRLDSRHEVVLHVAALLHDVGMFIGNSGHHKHSQYIIGNSDLFGLGRQEIQLAAMIARYHRQSLPRPTHADFVALNREQRLVLGKLASILRVADALDRSHTQAIRNFSIVLEDGRLVVESGRPGEHVSEKRALVEKGSMFEQVYGRTVELRPKKKRK